MKDLVSPPFSWPQRANSAGLAASLVVKASRGALLKLKVFNSKASEQYVQLHDAAALPADTAVPLMTYRVPADSTLDISEGIEALPFSTGIVVCNSTDAATKTLGAADCLIVAVYR